MNTGRDYIRAHVQAAERHRTMLDSLMRRHRSRHVQDPRRKLAAGPEDPARCAAGHARRRPLARCLIRPRPPRSARPLPAGGLGRVKEPAELAMKRSKLEPIWRPGYKAPKQRKRRMADPVDRLAMAFAAHEETQAILARSRLYVAREDLVDLFAARCAQLELDVPTTTATLEAARALLSPRAQAGLDGLPAEQRAITAHAVLTGAHLELWDRRLSEGQPWPDSIDWTPNRT